MSAGGDCVGAVVIPDGVTRIGDQAFNGATELTSINIPTGVTSIDNYAFSGATALISITIPSSVTSIGDSAFYGASALTSITIPSSVTSIGDSAFHAASLTSIAVDSDNQNFTSVDGVLFNKAATTLIQYPLGKSNTVYSIPASVTSIGRHAFYHVTSLASVTFAEGSQLTSIGEAAFANKQTKMANKRGIIAAMNSKIADLKAKIERAKNKKPTPEPPPRPPTALEKKYPYWGWNEFAGLRRKNNNNSGCTTAYKDGQLIDDHRLPIERKAEA